MSEGSGLEYDREASQWADRKDEVNEEDLNHIPAGQPYSRLTKRFHGGIDFYGKDGQMLGGAQYSDLRSPHQRPEQNLLIFYFDAFEGHIRVTIRGRNLLKLYRYIRDHQMSWIQAIPQEKESPELRASKDPVVNAITFDHVTKEDGEDAEQMLQVLQGGTQPPRERINPPPKVRIVEPT